jgi:hypothetical protein
MVSQVSSGRTFSVTEVLWKELVSVSVVTVFLWFGFRVRVGGGWSSDAVNAYHRCVMRQGDVTSG